MHTEDDPTLWNDELWRTLERAIRAIRKRPQFMLPRPEFEEGLNSTAINRLAAAVGLGGPVIELLVKQDAHGRDLRRWIRVNHPGLADPLEFKVFERIGPYRISQSDVEDAVDYLKAWQNTRGNQLRSKATGSASGAVAAPDERPAQQIKARVQGEWSQPMSKKVLMARLGLKPSAFETFAKQHGLKQISRQQYQFRLDKLDSRTRERIETGK